MTSSASAGRPGAAGLGAPLAQVGGSRSWVMTFGVITLIAGLLVLIWPGQSIIVLAAVLGIWLLIAGVFRLISAIAEHDEARDGTRFLTALVGVLALLVGILCLARPLQTATALALLLGAFWVVGGAIETFHGVVGDIPDRGWAIAGGVVSVIAGIIVLAYPGASVLVLTWLFGLSLIVLGAVEIGRGATARKAVTGSRLAAGPEHGQAGPVTP